MERVVSLPPLTDFSQYIDPTNPILIPNLAILTVKDQLIYCSGLVLSLRSPVFKDLLLEDKEVCLSEFEGEVEEVYQCLKLLYGGFVSLTESNVFVIYKFGFIYKIECMVNAAMDWLIDVGNVKPKTFWPILHKFQHYQSHELRMVFSIAAINLIDANMAEFAKMAPDKFKRLNELGEERFIVHFLFSKISIDHLETHLEIFRRFVDHDVPNHVKESYAAEFVDFMIDHMHAIVKRKVDSRLLGEIFGFLREIMSSESNLEKLSWIHSNILEKFPESEADIILKPTEIRKVSQMNSRDFRYNQQSFYDESGDNSNSSDIVDKTSRGRKSSKESKSSRDKKSSNDRKSEKHRKSSKDGNPSKANNTGSPNGNVDQERKRSPHPTDASPEPINPNDPKYHHILSTHLIEAMTSSETSKDKVILFCQNSLLPSSFITEIGIAWIDNNRSCSVQTLYEMLISHVKHLPFEFCKQTVSRIITEYDRALHCLVLQNTGAQPHYSWHVWRLDKSRVGALSEGRAVRLRMRCTVGGCEVKGQQTVVFQYDSESLPAYKAGPDVEDKEGLHYHEQTVQHWLLYYKTQEGLDYSSGSNVSSNVSSEHSSGSYFSFVTNRDQDGGDFDSVLENIKHANCSVYLGCLYRYQTTASYNICE